MPTITDDFMRETISTTKHYCIVLLKAGPNRQASGVDKIIWEHGRRNFELRADGLLPIVCPVTDDSELAGVGIFTTTVEETRRIYGRRPRCPSRSLCLRTPSLPQLSWREPTVAPIEYHEVTNDLLAP